MKFEINLVRQQHQALGFPMRDAVAGAEPPEKLNAMEITGRRRAVRVQTDALIDSGLRSNDLVALSMELCAAMTAVAGSCVQLGIEPDLRDFVLAAQNLVQDARVPFERGLQVSEWDQARIGCAMVEIVTRGIAVCLNIPYEVVFEIMHKGYANGAEPDKDSVRAALRMAGHTVSDAVNEGGNAA